MMRRTRGLSTRLIVTTCTLVVLLLAVLLGVVATAHQSADRRARSAARLALVASSARAALAQLEASERGVAIARGRPDFVLAWRRSTITLRHRLDDLAQASDAGTAALTARPIAGARSYLEHVSVPFVAAVRRSPARIRDRDALAASERRVHAIGAQLDALVTRERATGRRERERASSMTRLAFATSVLGITALLTCALLFLAYVRRAVLTPLRGVAQAARALAAGDLQARVPARAGIGEVAELARTFDQMAASLEESRGELERQNAELEAQRSELIETARSAREAERAKDEFFALVSHELRTPLTAIVGYVELLLGEDAETIAEDHARHLEAVERNARRLLRLVSDLLFAAEVEAGALLLEPGEVDLAELVRDATELARPQADRAGVALTARIAPLAPCLGDRDRLAQVLDNVVSNAIKFTPCDGHVAIALDADDAGAARIRVADSGIGIPPRELPRLFDRFYRATNAAAGTVPGLGLGLTIVRAIVEGHGGSVEVESAIGQGTTFTILLPLAVVPPSDAPATERYAGEGR